MIRARILLAVTSLVMIPACRTTVPLEPPKPINVTRSVVRLGEVSLRELAPAESTPTVIRIQEYWPRLDSVAFVINDTLLHLPGRDVLADSLVTARIRSQCVPSIAWLRADSAWMRYGELGGRRVLAIRAVERGQSGSCPRE